MISVSYCDDAERFAHTVRNVPDYSRSSAVELFSSWLHWAEQNNLQCRSPAYGGFVTQYRKGQKAGIAASLVGLRIRALIGALFTLFLTNTSIFQFWSVLTNHCLRRFGIIWGTFRTACSFHYDWSGYYFEVYRFKWWLTRHSIEGHQESFSLKVN